MTPRKVLHIRSSGGLLGAEQVLLSISRNSKAFGYESLIAVSHDADCEIPTLYTAAQQSGIPCFLLACQNKFDLRPILQLRKIVKQENINLLHTHGYRENFYALASFCDVPIIATNHLWKRTTLSLRLYAALDSYLIRHMDHVVAVSNEIADELRPYLRPNMLSRISNGVDINKFWQEAQETKHPQFHDHSVANSDKKINLISIGSLTEEKGLNVMLEALPLILKYNPATMFYIVGSGPQRNVLQNQAAALNIESSIEFLGRREDIPQLLRKSHIFVLPSLKEGLPIALLEAMASGVASVATDVGDISQVIVHGMNGLLVRAGDSRSIAEEIIKLIQNSDLRLKIAREGQKTVITDFSELAMTKAYCQIYDSITSNTPSP